MKDNFVNFPITFIYKSHYIVRSSILRGIRDNIEVFKGVLLDVGCGSSPYKELLKKESGITSYIGLDFKKSSIHDTSNADIWWDGITIPLPEDSVDTVMATEVFEHCEDVATTLKEIYRVLRPGGTLFFTVPFLWPLHEVPHDYYRYTPFSMENHLQRAKFIKTKLTTMGGSDAAMAQMFSLWYGARMPFILKQIFYPLVPLVIFILLYRDKKNSYRGFYNDSMITGIVGTAQK